MKFYLRLLIYTMFLITAPYFSYGLQHTDPKHHSSDAAISSIENFLNSLESYEADFEQIADDNSKRLGKLYILKPDRVRLEYSKPASEVLIIDKDFITHYMPDIDEVNFMPNDGIPISIFGKNHINLRKDFKVLKLNDYNEFIEVVLEIKYKDQVNTMSITFSKFPFGMARIAVTDENNSSVNIKLISNRVNHPLNPALFEIKRPD